MLGIFLFYDVQDNELDFMKENILFESPKIGKSLWVYTYLMSYAMFILIMMISAILQITHVAVHRPWW